MRDDIDKSLLNGNDEHVIIGYPDSGHVSINISKLLGLGFFDSAVMETAGDPEVAYKRARRAAKIFNTYIRGNRIHGHVKKPITTIKECIEQISLMEGGVSIVSIKELKKFVR